MKMVHRFAGMLCLLLALSMSSCSLFKSRKCDCPNWGQKATRPPAERPA